MHTYFFDMKDGVPQRDRVGLEFMTNADAIQHCRDLARHIRNCSLRDGQDFAIAVVNGVGSEIFREFVHR